MNPDTFNLSRQAEATLLRGLSKEVAQHVKAVQEAVTWASPELVAGLLSEYKNNSAQVVKLLDDFAAGRAQEETDEFKNLNKRLRAGEEPGQEIKVGVGMESLPLEVVEMISKELSPQDLAACCAVSHSWRDLFNQDLLWRPYCDPLTAECLRNTKCLVEPRFVSPEDDESGLTSVCEWRISYMRQNHLWNNWRQGNFTWGEINFPNRGLHFDLDLWFFHSGRTSLFYKNEFIFQLFQSRIQVWDVRENPILYMKEPCLFLPRPVEYREISGNKLVVVQYYAVQVFQISLLSNKWPLQHVFLFHGQETCNISVAEEYASQAARYTVPTCLVVGNYFIGLDPRAKKSLHIWDIETGTKVKEEVYKTKTLWKFVSIGSCETSSTNIVVTVHKRSIDGDDVRRILIYNLTKLAFEPFMAMTYNDHFKCTLLQPLIVTSSINRLKVYNYKTCRLVKVVPHDGRTDCFMFNNKIIYRHKGVLKQVTLSFEDDSPVLNLNFKVSRFITVCNKFIIVELTRDIENDNENKVVYQEWAPGSKTMKEVWEIGTKPRKTAFWLKKFFNSRPETNKTCTKLLLEQNHESCTTVINFW